MKAFAVVLVLLVHSQWYWVGYCWSSPMTRRSTKIFELYKSHSSRELFCQHAVCKSSSAEDLSSLGVDRVTVLAPTASSLLASVLLRTRAASAASLTPPIATPPVYGWDLFGRVPYDDWLFTNRKLLDPNLLRRSMVEAVVQELPDALASFQRRRNIKAFFRSIKIISLITLLALITQRIAVLGHRWFTSDQNR
jgi:hypothetical protein